MKKAPAKMKKKSMAKKKKLTDLSGDGKVTKKDVLIGRGVIDAPTKMKKSAMKMKKESMAMMKKSVAMMKKASAMKMKMKSAAKMKKK